MAIPRKYFTAEEAHAARLEANRRYNARHRPRKDPDEPRHHHATSRHEPPWCVLAERDAAAFAPRSLTALMLGDPPAGRSALDKRGGRA